MPDIAERIVNPDPLTTLRALADAKSHATPGEWGAEPHYATCRDSNDKPVVGYGVPKAYTCGDGECPAMSRENAVFIAACCNTDFTSLLRAFKELQSRIDALAEALECYECPECGDEAGFCDCDDEDEA